MIYISGATLGAMSSRMRFPVQQHPHHFGTCKKLEFSTLSLPTESETLTVRPSNLYFQHISLVTLMHAQV